MAFVIPCKKCRWQNPMIEVESVQEFGVKFRIRCLKCRWEGYALMPVQYSDFEHKPKEE
jgi:hypothetical protein